MNSPATPQPYIGLRPFAESERDRFFGRDREISILLDKIRANRLTLLLAASGVGKSSLLQAGIMPALRADSNIELIYHRDWAASPQAFKQAVSDHYGEPHKDNVSLKSILRACTLFSSGQQIILLDQFEEFFNYQRFRAEFLPFIEELSAAILDRSLPASFVFSMREDFALELNSFKPFLPGVLDSYFRLEKLTRDQARLAIEEPLKPTGWHFEQDGGKSLLEEVLNDLAKREQERQFGVQELLNLNELPLLVEPPHLQIVCQELWQHHRDEAVKQITHAAYQESGRAEGILETYFLRKIGQFNKKEQALASAAFDHLVGQRATKVAHPLERLAELTRAAAQELQAVLDKLQDCAVLRRQKRGEEFWYELYHDIFSESIDKWNRELKHQQRRKRLAVRGVAALIAGGLIFAGNNWQANYYGRWLQSQEGVFNRIEVNRGTEHGWDVFGQRGFLYESSFVRQELEADKRFDRSIVEDRKNAQANLVSRLPLLERLPVYAKNGLYRKADEIARNLLESNKKDEFSNPQFSSLPDQLAYVRASMSVKLLLKIAEKQVDREYTPKQTVIPVLARLGDQAALRKFLMDTDVNVQLNAAAVLGQLGDKSAVQRLDKFLLNEDANVRQGAAYALGNIGTSSAAPALIKLFEEDKDAYARLYAANALSQLGGDKSALIKLLKDEDANVRANAAYVLGQSGDKSVAPALLKLMKDESANVRSKESTQYANRLLFRENPDIIFWIAAEALSKLGDKLAVPALLNLLKDENADVRANAAYALGNLSDKSVVSELVNLLKDENADVRRKAVNALGQLGDKSAAPEMRKLLEDADADMKRQAASSLGKLGDKLAVPALLKFLHDKDMQLVAPEALGNIGDKSAVPALLKLFNESKIASYVRLNAANALDKLGDNKSSVSALRELLADTDTDVRLNAAEALDKLGDKSAEHVLIKLLKGTDGDPYVPLYAAYILGRKGDYSAAPNLLKLLADTQPDSRVADVQPKAAEVLGQLGDSSFAPELLKLLKDTDRVNAEDTRMISGFSSSLLSLLTDKDKPLVRLYAVEALGGLKAKRTAFFLSKYFKNATVRKLRDAAAKALVNMNGPTPALQDWQKEQFKTAQEHLKSNEKKEAAAAIGYVFTKESVMLLSGLLADAKQDVIQATVKSIGRIGEYHPGLVQMLAGRLLEMATHANTEEELRQTSITALGQLVSFHGKEKPAVLPELDRMIYAALDCILNDPQEKFIIRKTALDALGATGRERSAQEIYDFLTKLDAERDEFLICRCLHWLGRMAYSQAKDHVEKELKQLEKEKAAWREKRDSDNKEKVLSDQLEPHDKSWRKERWEYMLGNALASIAPEERGIPLLGHPLYQVRQGAVRALASRIADGKADAALIGKIIQAHQNFNPDDLPSPFPYTAFQAIDLALWNLEYTGKENDLKILKDILSTVKRETCRIPGQEGAIQERLEWTIKRLEENLAENTDKFNPKEN